MADLSKMILPNGDEYTLRDSGIVYCTSDTAASTAAKVIDVADNAPFTLRTGSIIAVKFSVSNSANNVTFNVAGTGAKTIWYNDAVYTGKENTVCGYANRVYYYAYDGEHWAFLSNGIINADTYTRTLTNCNIVKVGSIAIVASNLIVAGEDGLYKHLKSGTAFDLRYPILYAPSAVNANATTSSTYINIAFTITTTQSITLTAQEPVYIKGQLSGTIFTPISATPLTQDIPTAEDGYEYIFLGVAYSTTAVYLWMNHPIYAFRGGKFTEIVGDADTVGGMSPDDFVHKTGDTITGALNVEGALTATDETYLDSATVGNLLVNGSARFVNTINGNAKTADKVNNQLKIQLNSGTTEGTNQYTYDGSAAKNLNITKSSIGLDNVENKSSATIRGELTKANVTTALGYTPYTPAEVDSLVSSVFNYKGTKATFAEVQALTGMKTGDVWQVTADNSEYVYNGTTWEKLGPTIDLSGYLTDVSIAGQTLTPSSNSITVAQLKTALGLKAAAYVDTESTLANDAKLPTGAAVKTYVDGKVNVVTQTATTTNANYRVLFSQTADDTTRTEGTRKNSNLTFNPSTGNLATTKIGGKNVDELIDLPTYQVGTINQIVQTKNNFTRPNRLVFLPPDQVIIEQTTDGGTTWTDAGVSDAAKANLFSGIDDGSVAIPLLNGEKSTNCGIRITFTAMRYNVPEGTPETQKYQYWNKDYVLSTERYCSLELLWFWVSANNDRIRVYAYRSNGGNPNNWITLFNTDFGLQGRSGSNWIRFSSGVFGGRTDQTGQPWNYRLEFYSRLIDGKTEFQSTTKQYIHRIFGYGQYCWTASNRLMQIDHLYYWDSNKNATFPANVSATNFIGNLTGNVSGTAECAQNGCFYCTCATAAGTATKVVTTADPGFALREGVVIGVKYTNTNSATSVTLNVNNTGAKSIYYDSNVYTGSEVRICGYENRIIYYMYDGTNWVFLNISSNYINSDTYTSAMCGTSAGTAAKTASCTYYTAKANSYLHVVFRYSNTAASALTLNINSQDAKPIYINGAASSASNYTLPAGSYICFYDGTNYYFRNDVVLPGEIEKATNVTGTVAIANGGTGATTAANARSNLGLGNVENKSSATIRDEITSDNVTDALGYTPPLSPFYREAAVKATKTYTGVIATDTTAALSNFYAVKITPDSYSGSWSVLIRIRATIAGVNETNGLGFQESYFRVEGMRNTYATYYVWNNIRSTSYRPYYYHEGYWAKSAGLTNGYTHLLGVGLRSSWNPTTAANSRTFTFDILDYSDCAVDFLDNMLIYADVPGTGSTNYQGNTEFNGSTQGFTRSGTDANQIDRLRIATFKPTAGAVAIYPYTICLKDSVGTYQSIVTSNSTGTSKSRNTNGFVLEGIYYWNSSGTLAVNTKTTSSDLFYTAIPFNLQYSTNCGTSLVVDAPVYLVGAMNDGLFYLDSTWWTQELPDSEDGKIYIFLGHSYSTTNIQLSNNHPIYWYKGGAIREYVDSASLSTIPITNGGTGATTAANARSNLGLGSQIVSAAIPSSGATITISVSTYKVFLIEYMVTSDPDMLLGSLVVSKESLQSRYGVIIRNSRFGIFMFENDAVEIKRQSGDTYAVSVPDDQNDRYIRVIGIG